MTDNYFSLNLQQKVGTSTSGANILNANNTSSASPKLFNMVSNNLSETFSVSSDSTSTTAADETKDTSTVSTEGDDLTKELQEAQAKLEEDNNKLQAEQMRLELEKTRLEQYAQEYEQMQEQLKELNETIAETQEKEIAQYQDNVNDVIDKAMSEYDPEKDGSSFEQYVKEALASAGYSTFSSQELDSLDSSQKTLAMKANNLLGQISVQSSIVNNISTNIAALQANFDASSSKVAGLEAKVAAQQASVQSANSVSSVNGVEGASSVTTSSEVPGEGLTAKELLSKIDPRELEIVKEYNVDMTNCVVAKGKDGKFHIYEKLTGDEGYFWGEYGNIARKYLPDRGFDICPMGSGEIGTLKDATDCDVENFEGFDDSTDLADQWYNVVGEVYTFTSINDCLTDGEVTSRSCSYCTASPLSFDIDGDGVNTSEEIIQYDIDGDGKTDTINNSDEWVLAFDKDKDGIAGEDGSELFGDNTDLDGDGKADGYKDGFEALKALAEKENLIDDNDRTLDEEDLSYLGEKYGLVMTDGYGGEAKSLEELGVDEINLAKTDETTLTKNFDGRNNDIMTQEGATFKVNGETREYADIWNAKFNSGESVSTESYESVSGTDNAIDDALSDDETPVDETVVDDNDFAALINQELLSSEANLFSANDGVDAKYDEILTSEINKAVAEHEVEESKKDDEPEDDKPEDEKE